MKVSELSGVALDLWVAKAEGFEDAHIVLRVDPSLDAAWRVCIVGLTPYLPSIDPGVAWPIIASSRISLLAGAKGKWRALRSDWEKFGPTVEVLDDGRHMWIDDPLEAAMRLRVLMAFGDEVSV
jgi:hypothetical protein